MVLFEVSQYDILLGIVALFALLAKCRHKMQHASPSACKRCSKELSLIADTKANMEEMPC